jgi:hypothetical protein
MARRSICKLRRLGHHVVVSAHESGELTMLDLVFIAVGAGFFAACWFLAKACEKL